MKNKDLITIISHKGDIMKLLLVSGIFHQIIASYINKIEVINEETLILDDLFDVVSKKISNNRCIAN